MIAGKKSRTRTLLFVELPMVLILLFTLGPYLWMLLTSLTAEDRLFTQQRRGLGQPAAVNRLESDTHYQLSDDLHGLTIISCIMNLAGVT